MNEGFDVASLMKKGYLDFSAALTSGGRDCEICFAVFPRRQQGDIAWIGDITQSHLVFIALTRASGKCFAVVENLSREMIIPPNDKQLTQEAWHLGLRVQKPITHTRDYYKALKLSKYQMPLVRLVDQGRQHWTDNGIPKIAHRAIKTNMYKPSPPGCRRDAQKFEWLLNYVFRSGDPNGEAMAETSSEVCPSSIIYSKYW